MANNTKNSKKNTSDRPLGLLIDGTELYSPSIFNESIYFGGISQVDISNSGKNYDVITPSSLTIRGNSGISSGAKIYGNMMGELAEILVLSPGIGYKTKPNLTIVGGNFKGSVKLDTNLLQKSINSAFLPNSVGVANSTITFISDHNFEDGDEIIYNSNNSTSVTGLIPTTSYFVGIIDSKTISLYNTVGDALNKVNFIGTLAPIAGVTTSIHYFYTRNVKNIIDKVYIENSNAVFYNRIVKIPNNSHPNSRDLNGINIAEDYIYAKNHNLKEGDLVVYSSTGSVIAGLNTTSQYFVTVVDENKFKLSNAGSSKINPNKQDYLNKVYVNFTSRGSGTHTFKYPEIEIITSVVSGITSTKAPSLEPVVLGSFDSIFIEDEGSGYGISNVVNLQVFPDVIVEGTNLEGISLSNEASFQPVIVEGKIVDVIVLNSGDNYNKNIDIVVEGQGKYARLYPTIENKKITKVSVLSEGVGYDLLSTRIYAKRRGIGAKFLVNVKKWTINQYFKNKTTIDNNSGNSYVVPSRNVKNSLQSITFYPPGELRDLVKDGEAFRDANPTNEPSPILGWAYDGNPILGPYIENENASGVSLIPSSYRLKNTNTLNNLLKRPRGFAGGYFIEDYEYVESLSQLDENNGMYVKNSDLFPNGTYAYFLTLNPSDKSPTYPYVVGPEFKNEPNETNFDPTQNQNIDFTTKSYLKNTSSLYLTSTNSGYDYINPIQDKYKQELIVKNVLSSKIDGFKIINSGTGYKIGDRLEFSSASSDDLPPDAFVFELTGKNINNITVGITTISDIKFKIKNNEVIGVSSAPHTIKNNDYITIKNSNNSNLNGVENVEVVQKTCSLLSNHNSSGVSTYIEVDDITEFEVDDYIDIDDEIAKILEVYPTSSKFFVERLENVGVHTSGESLVKILPSKFKFRNKSILGGLTVENQRYFNPKYSIGIGTTGTVVNNTESYLTYFVPEKCIHIPNHNYTTNQEVVYTKNSSFSGLLVSNTPTSTPYRLQNNQTLYVINQGKDLIGLTTVAYGVTSLTFRETSYPDDEIHSFKYTRNETSGDVNIFSLQINTNSSHNLIDGDEVTIDAVEDTFEYYVAQIDFNQTYKVNIVNNSNFKLNLKNKPQFIEFPETQNPPLAIKALNPDNFKYNTTSRTASGGIKNVKIINSSSFYKEIPTITGIDSVNGNGAIILATSKTIGKIDTVERIKDGFDYPSDITLQPKLSTNIICYVTDNKKIKKVDVLYSGRKYNTPPNLKVIGRDDIVLKSNLRNFSVSSVKVVKNVTNLSDPLEIIPVNNSNGFDILDIFNVSPDTNRILVDKNQFPFIYSDYTSPEIDFPFEIGDYIFIENCKITGPGDLNYNSSDFNYSTFEVVGINTNLGRIDYRVTQSDFGTYTTDNGYGTVINKKDLAVFEMQLETCDFYQGESVEALFNDGNVKFSADIIDVDGWNSQKNQLRLTNSFGTLVVGDILKGSKSLIEAKVIDTNSFTSQVKFGSSRLKVNNTNEFNDLNSDIKRLQDSNYYQDFSYSIVSKIQYDDWKEPVKSIIHPSGFKEFSDLQIISRSKNKNLRVGLGSDSSNLLFNVVIENEKYLGTRDNFTIGYDENRTSTVERVYFGSGDELWPVAGYGLTNVSGLQLLPFISNKSNQVIPLKLDGDFDGSYEIISLGTYSVTFNSNAPYYLGISTAGLSVGDIIGISTYNQYPNNTRIISVGINSVRILHPHKVYSGSVTQTLEIKRNLNGNQLVGISSFKLLTNANRSPFVVLAEPLDLKLGQDLIVKSHNFQTGQLLKYENVGGDEIGISQTNEVIGGISTNKLPPLVYVNRVSSNKFTLSGLSTSNPLNLTSIGSGIHKFTSTNQNESSLILIDNIIQSPLTKRNLNLSLSQDVGINTNIIYANSGITSITSIDILKIQNEYLKIISVGVSSENAVEVERGFLGSSILDHSGIQTASVYRGNYLIVDDDIYFTEPPFGLSGLEGLQVSSKFTGRTFSRSFSPQYPNDKNIILDDISDQFVGLSSFILKENGNDVVGLYTNTNSSSSGDINNNPIILINNIPQVTNLNFTIDNPNQNTINFISGTPKIGKILRFKTNDDNFGYSPLVAAAATVAVSPSGEISQIYLNGGGSGYRIKPNIEVVSRVGSGASISATVGASGSITSFTIVTPGIGYSTTEPPELIIDEPIPYYDLNVTYASSSSGVGTNAKVSLSINQNSKVDNIELINSGESYKVGDILNVVGIVTNTQAGNLFNTLELEVTEVASDTFSGIYPGQFIQFEDISSNFNSVIDSFDLYAVIDGVRTKILFKSDNTNKVENNFFVFLNDVLQEPLLAYKYVAGRLFFTEPPVEGSTCNILYYQGSNRDVDLVKPKQTIKVGDEVKLEDSDLNSILISQDNRVVRRIVSSNELDTFAYSGIGIFPEKVRPITWTKQKNDRVISGSLISKSREMYESRLYPTSKLIWKIQPEDTSFYVDNAYPLFKEYDDGIGGLTKDQRNVSIIPLNSYQTAEFNVNVSTSSTISSIDVENGGVGYTTNTPIYINSPQYDLKDPLYQWNFTSGISTTYQFNSIASGDVIIAVGNTNLIGISSTLNVWSLDEFITSPTINLNKVATSSFNNYYAVGSNGKIIKKGDKNSPWSVCGIKTESFIFGISQGVSDSNYTGTFNDIVYNPNIDTWIAVGDAGKIYSGIGISTDVFVESISSQPYDYKSVDYNSNVIIAVGSGGVSRSSDARTWFNVGLSGNYTCVFWSESDNSFIASFDNKIGVSTNGTNWSQFTTNPSINLIKLVKYNKVYIGIDDTNSVYTSIDLRNWLKRDLPSVTEVYEIKNIIIDNNDYVTLVGAAGSIYYSTPILHSAIVEANISNNQILSINVLDGGFGYSVDTPPGIIAETPSSNITVVNSVDVIGDYGKIVGIKTANAGIGTNSPRISFEFLSDYDTLDQFGVSYSNISVGDYFTIFNSNVGTLTGYALTGITTSLGGMSNYPESKVGTATTFLDGVYRVDYIENTSLPQGIVTVTCHVVPVNGGVAINTSGVTTNYYGNYSWSKIFNYNQKSIDFDVNTDNGLIGLNTGPIIQRKPSLIF